MFLALTINCFLLSPLLKASNYSSWAKSSLLAVFIYNVLLEHSHVTSFMFYLWLLSCYKDRVSWRVVTGTTWPGKGNIFTREVCWLLVSVCFSGGPKVLGWPKSSFGFFCYILQKTPNEFFGQPNKTSSLGHDGRRKLRGYWNWKGVELCREDFLERSRDL